MDPSSGVVDRARPGTFVAAVCLRFAVVVCAQSSRVPARLVVNDQDMGSVVALIEAEKIWLPLDQLRTMGFVADGAEVRVNRGTTFARLDTLRPRVEATLDADTITIRVTAGAAAFTGRTIDVARHRGDRRVPVARAPSAFLNYSFTSDAGQGTTVAGELGVSAKNAHFTASAVQSPVSGLTPGPIRFVFDDSERLNRWVVGDDVVGLGRISGATPLVGVTFSRAFAIDPVLRSIAGAAVLCIDSRSCNRRSVRQRSARQARSRWRRALHRRGAHADGRPRCHARRGP